MIEINQKRRLNSKHFDNGNGKIVMESHIGHIHYVDKLGGTGLREIDWTLSFDNAKRGWFFNHHSFRPFLPEYADGWVEFRDLYEDKDQTIKYKAVASHVLGRLVMPSEIGLKDSGVNCVIYDNAFGKGIDYILYFTRSCLKKVVRIRDGYKPTTDVSYDFEVDFPKEIEREVKKFRVENKEKLDQGYEFLGDTGKVFDSPKQLIIGNDKKDGKEYFTYLKEFKCWDNEKSETITVNYLIYGGKKYLRKNITKEFLDNSVGDVFTDTTTSYYSGAGDGYVGHNNANWTTCRGAVTGSEADYTGTMMYDNNQGNTNFYIRRIFLPFDTSGIGAGASISAATLYVYSQELTGATGNNDISFISSTQANNTSLTTADYDAFGATYFGVIPGTAGSAYLSTTLNASGLSNISPTGYSKFCGRNYNDYNDIVPGASTNFTMQMRTSEYAGTTSDPYLSVTYTPGGSSAIKSINGLAIGSVKSVNGLAIGSVKNINGLV